MCTLLYNHLRSSEVLRSVDWWFVTEVSGQSIGPIFKDQAVQFFSSPWTVLHLKVVPISCPETSVTNYESMLRKIPEKRRSRCSLFLVPCFIYALQDQVFHCRCTVED
jgi:hypothetical protein